MKKSIILASIALGAFSAFATAPAPADFGNKASLTPVGNFRPVIKKAMTPVSTQIITTVANGTVMKEVIWSSKAGFPENGKLTWADVSGFVPTIVTNGVDMYIFSPLTTLSELATAWIKGEISLDESKVTFPTPQAYMINEAIPGVQTMLYATRVDKQTGKPVEGNMNLEFSYVDGELTQTDGGILMLTDLDGNFYGYAEMDIAVKKIKDTPTMLPENAEVWSYMMEYKKSGEKMHQATSIAYDGGDVYLADPVLKSDCWIKGRMKDGKLVIPTPQYMGSSSGYPLYLVTGSEFTYWENDPLTGQQYEVVDYNVKPNAEIVFDYDPATLVYSTSQLILLNSEKDKKGAAISAFTAPVYTPWTPAPVAPAAPEITYYFDLKEYESYGLRGCMLSFNIPDKSAEGGLLPQENIYYQICFDEMPLEFYGTSMLPFFGQFQDAAIETSLTFTGTAHSLQTPLKPTESLSIQSFYEFEGQYIASEKVSARIVNGELEDSAVEEAAVEVVKTSEFFDLSGRKVSGDTKGIVIRRDVMADGSVRNIKVINK